MRAVTQPKGKHTEKVITGHPVRDFLLGFLPGMAWLEGMREGVGVGGAAADTVREKTLQGPVGQHTREIKKAMDPQ